MRHVDGIGEITRRFRTVFVDAYGVLHDDAEAFPGVAEALGRLREAGVTVVVLTNSTGRAEAVKERLAQAGVGRDLYDHVATGGELAWDYIGRLNAAGDPPPLFVIREGCWPRWIEDLPNRVVQDIDAAAIMIAAGMPYSDEAQAMASKLPGVLRAAARRAVPLIVADPDEVYPSRGTLRLGPGWIGRVYAEMGGPVIPFGKPHAAIYQTALSLAGHPTPAEVLMVGDNLATDIAGAAGLDLSSLLILGSGVHATLSDDELSAAALRAGVFPTFTSAAFVW